MRKLKPGDKTSPKVIPNLGLPIPKSAAMFHIPAYSQVGIATWKVADLLVDRQPVLQAVVLRKNQRCRIWTGCLISLVRTPGISFGFIAGTYHSHYYLAELALQPYQLTGTGWRVGGMGKFWMEGVKPVYCP